MDSGTQTEQIEDRPGRGSTDLEPVASSDAPTERLPGAGLTGGAAPTPDDGASTQVHAPLVATRRDQCAACGSALAPDQRYCVECGERRGRARVPQLEGLGERGLPASGNGPQRKGGGLSVNNTLLAVIGTLLLALGVGVLIGRTSNGSSSKAPPVRVVSVAGTGVTSSGGTTATQQGSESTAAGAKTGKSGGAAAKTAAKHSKVSLKVVTVGSAGKGPGYQHGHFTGNFFGPESEEKK
jgi:hypothetical protein